MNRRPARHGFTLVEVLAALVLIGIVLPVVTRGITLALQTAGRARHVSEATELARHKLTELSLNTDPSTYVTNGDFGIDWPGYRFESSYVSRDYGVNELKVEVFWKAQGNEQSIALTTLTYPGAYLVGSSTTSTTGTDSSSSTGSTP